MKLHLILIYSLLVTSVLPLTSRQRRFSKVMLSPRLGYLKSIQNLKKKPTRRLQSFHWRHQDHYYVDVLKVYYKFELSFIKFHLKPITSLNLYYEYTANMLLQLGWNWYTFFLFEVLNISIQCILPQWNALN